ncbi:hypothetical protein ANO14919_002100 [Xylariales sp. No.14919]|nr:hypothetical protein ANO14919_002100 [Xylariales sp. No.14919]
MAFEDGGQRHLFEITRDQPSEELIGPGPGVPLLADNQTTDHHRQ